MEREIMRAHEGIEDEDGNTSNFLKKDDPDMPRFVQQRSNTGVKGVMEDSRQHYAMFALQQQADIVRRRAEVQRLAGKGVKPVDVTDGGSEGGSDDEFDDDEDAEFMAYKLERLKQMQRQAAQSSRLPSFGRLESIDVFDYPEAVDNPGSDQTYVVVHLSEEHVAPCVRLNLLLEAIAARYDQVRFLNVCASDARESLTPSELPILIAYQAGQYLGSIDKVGREKGDALKQEDVEEHLMRDLRVRLTAAAAMREADMAALERIQEMGLESKATTNRRQTGPQAGRRVDGRSSDEDDDEEEDDDE